MTNKTAEKVVRLTREDYERIVNWPDVEENFNTMYGTCQKTKFDGECVTKISKLDKLAKILNMKSNNQLQLTGKLLQYRTIGYRQKFQKTKAWLSQKTGAGVSLDEQQSGVRTSKELLEKKCLFYERMNNFFGNKANINQPCVVEHSMIDSEDEGIALDDPFMETTDPELEFSLPLPFRSLPSHPPPSLSQTLPLPVDLPSRTRRLSRRQQRSSTITLNAGQQSGTVSMRSHRSGMDIASSVTGRIELEEKKLHLDSKDKRKSESFFDDRRGEKGVDQNYRNGDESPYK